MNTTFILGAGASKDIGFPDGTELIDQIASIFNQESYLKIIKRILWNNREELSNDEYSKQLPNSIYNNIKLYNAEKYWSANLNELNNWISKLGGAESIDQFIYYRPEYSILSKLGILTILSKYETPEKFLPQNDSSFKRYWYHQLWQILCRNCKNYLELTDKIKRMEIITFNYDRSLDYFLQYSIKCLFENKLENSQNDINNLISIHHIYGTIGNLNKSDKANYREYKTINLTSIPRDDRLITTTWTTISAYEPNEVGEYINYDKYILKLALNIKTYNEDYTKDIKFKIQNIIKNSSNLYFFGFAFHKQNLELLFSRRKGTLKKLNFVGGTCYKMAKNRLNEVKLLIESLCADQELKIVGFDEKDIQIKISDYIRNNDILI